MSLKVSHNSLHTFKKWLQQSDERRGTARRDRHARSFAWSQKIRHV